MRQRHLPARMERHTARPTGESAGIPRRNRAQSGNQPAELQPGNAAIVALDEFAECLPDGTEPITDTVALRAAFDSFLASLPERERVIFVRRYWYLCPVAEIARGMDIPEGTVKSILSRTRERFRIHLEKEGIFV